jgi:hypothetical protein
MNKQVVNLSLLNRIVNRFSVIVLLSIVCAHIYYFGWYSSDDEFVWQVFCQTIRAVYSFLLNVNSSLLNANSSLGSRKLNFFSLAYYSLLLYMLLGSDCLFLLNPEDSVGSNLFM